MKSRLIVLLSFFLFSCTTSPKAQRTSEIESTRNSVFAEKTIPLAGTLNVERYLFKNGLHLLVVVDPSSPTFAYQTWFKVGSRNEVPGKTGLAHLFEHMMFKGTKTRNEGEFDRLLEGAGAQGENAFTSEDYTAYIQELPQGNLDLIAQAESDRMVNLIVNEASFKTEREVVQNERRYRNENNPDGLMDQELHELAFTKSPYHWPVIGYQTDLDQMTAEDARAFYKKFYNPNHATIVVTGDVNPGVVQKTIEKYYGNLPSQAEPPQSIAEEPPQTSPRRKILHLNMKTEKLLMGYPIPPLQHPDIPSLNMLQNILAGGKSSRLQRSLVDTGIATSVEAFAPEAIGTTLFTIEVNLQQKKRAAQAEAVILKELSRLSKEQVPEQELSRSKNRFNFSFYRSLTSNFTRAYFLGLYETIAGDFREGIRLTQLAQEVNPEQIQMITQKYFHPHSRTVITGVPKK